MTFVSPTHGLLLGQAPCGSQTCTALVETLDAGQTWHRVPAPAAGLLARAGAAQGTASGVSEVRFADAANGWVFGPALWATHDGSHTWQPVAVPGRILDLAAADGIVDAVVSSCVPDTSCSAPTRLFRSPVGRDEWTVVPGVTGAGWGMVPEPIALHGRTGYVALGSAAGSGTSVFATGDGTDWHRVPDPCSTQQPADWKLAALAAPDDTILFELCSGSPGAGQAPQRLFRSADRGTTPVPVGPAYRGFDNQLLTAPSPAVLIEGQWSAATELSRSIDGGQTFRPATAALPSGGVPLSDLGFTTTSQGVVVVGGPEPSGVPDELLMSRDGGASWVTSIGR